MSYNMRRGTPVQNVGNRRPVVTNNFVAGGQLTPQKGGIQQQSQQQSQGGYVTQQTQPTRAPQSQPPQQRQTTPQQKAAPQKQVVQQQKLPVKQEQPSPAPQKIMEGENGSDMITEGEGKKKWNHRKIPKREKIKRRNMRLSKLLQPKNALMILHELVKNPIFHVVEYVSTEGTQHKAMVSVEGVEHSGFGKSKACAKNAAAEVALKYLIKHKKMTLMSAPQTEEGAEQMDTSEGDETESTLPWQQVASFALFKLFDAWGESLVASPVRQEAPAPTDLKPAKKMPDNAETLNPIMVVNQMYPHAQYEELPKTGTPPNYVFTMKCTVAGQPFSGSGSTKKLAKRNVAFVVCNSLLGIQYAPDVYTPAL